MACCVTYGSGYNITIDYASVTAIASVTHTRGTGTVGALGDTETGVGASRLRVDLQRIVQEECGQNGKEC